jgi:hypothetical protein
VYRELKIEAAIPASSLIGSGKVLAIACRHCCLNAMLAPTPSTQQRTGAPRLEDDDNR